MLLLWLACQTAQAQFVTFNQAVTIATQDGPYSTITPTALAVDPAGNTYLTGYFYDVVTLGTTTLQHTRGRIFVAKRDPSGRYVWVVQAGGGQREAGTDIAVDAGGNVYITGYFDNARATFGHLQLQQLNGRNGFVAKLSPAGTWLWAVQDGGYATVWPTALALDSQANVYITGHFEESPAVFGPYSIANVGTGSFSRDAFVAKLNTSGQWQWARGIGGSGNEEGQDVAVDAADKVHIIGDFTSSSLAFGSDMITNYGSSNVFVAELDAQGTPQWLNGGGGDNWDRGATLAVDQQGNTYVAGRFFSTVAHFGTTDLYKTGLDEVFVGKLDPFGVWLWAKRAGGTGSDNANSMAVDSQGNVYVTGSHESAYFTAGFSGVPQIGKLDAYVFKLNATTGDCLWLTSGGGTMDDAAGSIVLDRSGKVYLAGTFQQEADFGPIHLTAALPHSLGFVTQINGTGLPMINSSKNLAEVFIAYPNPTQGIIHIAGVKKGEELELYDHHGKLTWNHICQSAVEKIILPTYLNKGLYTIHVKGAYRIIILE
ncbi:SBBP repeat-containing protein [Hymenobacter sublimis]|uniref:SBBP repeat-containing protein n=1 Tax=Hymenobacter sublimis TaxID=2933777 RepID=A0ABY4JCK8_9BACT|nr:SBBP repeat-containing protein [Hymenobacter sublimis]UPL50206.1 SBBP repeat-containing protein [Hymenobacter sublimis]